MSEASINQDDLPTTWALTNLGSVINYGSTSKAEPHEIADDDWVLELEDIEKDSSRLLQKMTFLQRQSKSTKNYFQAGDVLYGKLRPYLNKVLIADEPGYCTTEILPLKTGIHIDNRYLFYWLKHPVFLKYVEAESHGMNMPRLGTETGKAAPFVLAPRNEQTRIANQLDTLLARVQACNDRFDAIPALLKRFRQTVLRAATSGVLTAAMRAERGWSDSWVTISLGELGELGRGKSKHRPRNDPRLFGGEYPFIQTGDVAQSDGVITEHRQTYSEFGLQQSKLWPAGTICITIAANIADTAILHYPACFPDSVVGFVADEKKCINAFVKWWIDVIKDDLEAFAPATAQKNINLAVLNDVMVPCPSLDEQTEIVRRVEALFALADRIETRCTAARAQAQRLNPLVLAKAFRGELVPQDPNDEPASALLERIAAQRAAPAERSQSKKPRQARTPQAPKEATAMTKSRQDEDVKDKPYLADHLRRLATATTAEELFKASELPVADFYKQLAWEVARGHIEDGGTTLEVRHAAG